MSRKFTWVRLCFISTTLIFKPISVYANPPSEGLTDVQKVVLFLQQFQSDFDSSVENATNGAPLDTTNIAKDRLEDYEQYCFSNQFLSATHSTQIEKVRKLLTASMGDEGANAQIKKLDWDSEKNRVLACMMSYMSAISGSSNSDFADSVSELTANKEFDNALKILKKREAYIKKFDSVSFAVTKNENVKQAVSTYKAILDASKKQTLDKISFMAKAVRVEKLEAGKSSK